MLIWEKDTLELASRKPELLCSFGITETIGAFIISAFIDVGIGEVTAGILGPIVAGGLEGAGLGAATGAITGGNPGLGALYGGLGGAAFGGLGELGAGTGGGAGAAAGASDSGLGLSAGFASDSAIAGGAGGGVAGGAEGGLAGGLGAETGASFADTFGSSSGFASDSAISGGAGAAEATPAISAGPGISAGTDIPTSGFGASAPIAPGPGAAASAPPTLATGTPTVDLTSSFGGNTGLADTQGGNLFTGASDSATGGAPAAATPEAAAAPEAGTQVSPAFGTKFSPADSGEFLVPADANGPAQTIIGTPPTPPSGGVTSPATGLNVSDISGQFGLEGAVNRVGNFIEDNPLKTASVALTGAGLANSLFNSSNTASIAGLSDLASYAKALGQTGTSLIASGSSAASDVASNATSQAKTLENYLTTGTLPTAVQASLDRATNSAITNIKAKYASKGMPPNSTPEMQEIASLKQSSVIQGGSLAATLYDKGVSLDQLAGQIYTSLTSSGASATGAAISGTKALVDTNVSLNNATNNAIANLSAALGGGRVNNSINNTTTAVAA